MCSNTTAYNDALDYWKEGKDAGFIIPLVAAMNKITIAAATECTTEAFKAWTVSQETTVQTIVDEVEPEIVAPALSETFFESIALPLIARGFKVAPLYPKLKQIHTALVPDPLNMISSDPVQIRAWGQAEPNANVCVYATQEEGGLLFLDKDGAVNLREKYKQETGREFPKTLLVRSSFADTDHKIAKGHWYFYQTPSTIALAKNIKEGETGGLFSLRLHNQYVASIGSIHPKTGLPYEVVEDYPVAPMPDELLAWLVGLANKNNKTGDFTKKPEGWLDAPFIHHNIDNQLVAFAGHYITAKNISDSDELYTLLVSKVEKNGCFYEDGVTPFPINLGRVREIANDKVRVWKTGEQLKGVVTRNGVPLGQNLPDVQPKTQAPSQPKTTETEDVDPDERQRFVLSGEELAAEKKKPYPRILLHPPAGPVFHESMMYGPTRQLVEAYGEYCEGHNAGLYLSFLVALGNSFGRHAYFVVNTTRHYTTEFIANVGPTASGKGNVRDAVNHFMSIIDPVWAKERNRSGFGSAQGIIKAIRDDAPQMIAVRGKRGEAPTFKQVVKKGVDDKRLFIRGGELAGIFVLASKADSTASHILRDGWDGAPLENNVAGEDSQGMSNTVRCHEPHLSLSGDITREELQTSLPQGSESNGFGNRFCWVWVHRTKLCPKGGPTPDVSTLLPHFYDVIKHAQSMSEMPFDEAAGDYWTDNYVGENEVEEDTGNMVSLMTARRDPHTRRLAMILSLIDLDDHIRLEHVKAAIRIWDYCQQSAEFIFGGLTNEQEVILKWLRENGPATAANIRREIFKDSGSKPAGVVRAYLKELVKRGYLISEVRKQAGSRWASEVFQIKK